MYLKTKTMAKRLTYNEEENAERERMMIERSALYKYLRVDRELSIKKIVNLIGCRWHNRYNIFMEPEDYLTLGRMKKIRGLVPELSSKKFLDMLIPGDERPWYELEEWDTKAFKKKIGLD
jgi:hypothetical protein